MAKKKRFKKAKTSTERVRAHRERQGSKVQVNVTLPKSAVTRLDKLCKSTSQSRAAIIEQLLNSSAPARAAPKKTKEKKVPGGICRNCGYWKTDAELAPDSLGKKSDPEEIRYLTAVCRDPAQCAKNKRTRGRN